MTRNRSRRRGGRGSRGPAPRTLAYSFGTVLTFPAGTDSVAKAINYSDLGIDSSRSARVTMITLELSCANGSASGCVYLWGPAIGTPDKEGQIVNRSRLVSIGNTMRRVTVRMPRGTDYFVPGGSDTLGQVVFRASALGAGATGNISVVMSGTAFVQFSLFPVPGGVKFVASAFPVDDAENSPPADESRVGSPVRDAPPCPACQRAIEGGRGLRERVLDGFVSVEEPCLCMTDDHGPVESAPLGMFVRQPRVTPQDPS